MNKRSDIQREETAKRVRDLREKYGLSRAKLRERIGIPQRTTQSWEEQTTTPASYIVDWMEQVLESSFEKDRFTEGERIELKMAIDGRIKEYEAVSPKTPKQQTELDESINALKSAAQKIF